MKNKTVLFVDDDVCVLASLRRGLADEPYETLFADSGCRAVGLLLAHSVHVLVTDVRMPEMSGLELLEIVRSEYPEIMRLMLSGQPQLSSSEASSIASGVHNGEIFAFMAKPWDLEGQLKPLIRQALARQEQRVQSVFGRA